MTDLDMVLKLKKHNALPVIFLCCIVLLFSGCKYNSEAMIPMTPQEICDYMNAHFSGDFELINSKSEDTSEEKSYSAYMNCSLFPNRTVLTKHGYVKSKFGWTKTFVTNYNEIYYKKDIEQTYSALIDNWFNSFDYKAVYSTGDFLSDAVVYETLADYLKTSPLVYYTVVVNASDEEIKQYAVLKAKSVSYDIRNKREYPLRLYLYLWEDDDFSTLTEESIKSFGKNNVSGKESQYYYNEESLENYSL